MKTRTLIFSISALLLCCTACTDKQLGAQYDGEAGLAFASSVLNVEVSEEDGGQILVPVSRGSLSVEQAELSLEFENADSVWVDKDPAGLFSLVAKRVLFMDGSYTAYAQIHFTGLDDMGIGTKYRMRLNIGGNLSPSGRGSVIITASRKLTFDYLGKCSWQDICLFDNTYQADIYRAREAEIYRVADPYSEGLVAEEFAQNGWMGTPDEFVQFSVRSDGSVYYEPFCIGMNVQGKYPAYAYYPSEYLWGKDFSMYDAQNRKISDKEIQLYPVYCLPSMSYGFLNDGAYPITITLP